VGWIAGTESDRQDVWYKWTSRGKELFPNFVSEMKRRSDVFDPPDVDFVRRHVFYLGIKTKARKEALFDDVRDTFDRAGNEGLTAESGGARRTFSRLEIFELVEWIHRHNAKEVLIYAGAGDGTRDTVMKVPAGVYQGD
jgi:hypothetical protein